MFGIALHINLIELIVSFRIFGSSTHNKFSNIENKTFTYAFPPTHSKKLPNTLASSINTSSSSSSIDSARNGINSERVRSLPSANEIPFKLCIAFIFVFGFVDFKSSRSVVAVV